MDMMIYFLTVIPIGVAFLVAAWRYDEKHVPVGENFMPTFAELAELRKTFNG